MDIRKLNLFFFMGLFSILFYCSFRFCFLKRVRYLVLNLNVIGDSRFCSGVKKIFKMNRRFFI